MKERISYILRDPNTGFDPSELRQTASSITIPGVNASKEHQLTLAYSELPQELWEVLKGCHELHLRWSSSRPYRGISPFSSRVTPGLHLFYTPLPNGSGDRLCLLLKKVFGDDVKCTSPKETFVKLSMLSERFSASASWQLFHYLPTLSDMVVYLREKGCAKSDTVCQTQVEAILSADYIDIDYDAISHNLIAKAFWSRAAGEGRLWHDTHHKKTGNTVEIGILQNEKPLEPEELKYSGSLTVVGKDSKPSQTMFEFPARHHPLGETQDILFNASFKQPTGTHPTLILSLPKAALSPPADSCALHAYLTLPSFLFIDKYQLSDPMFLAAQSLKSLHAISGATDLEAPDWVIDEWGSAALLEAATPRTADPNKPWEISIPLHMRYLAPSNHTAGFSRVFVPWPVVFWACTAEEGSKFASSPFDRVNLGYDGLFGPRTMFYHIPPNYDRMAREVLEVPVMDLDRTVWVETGTILAIALGTFWVIFKLVRGSWVAKSNKASRKES